jgi:hypothetical protein
LNGANSTLERWAFSIGGTAAHEAGHTYGLTHANGATVLPGEDPLGTHIMPAGPSVTPEERAGSRRHFDDTSFGILAANVGLSVETIHNWDFTNPNGVDAKSIRFDLLSTKPTLMLSWSYGGNLSGTDRAGCTAKLGRSPASIVVSNLAQGRHIAQRHDGACLRITPRDSVNSPDVNECPNAGFNLDLFPATMLYITATVVDPAAQHWDVATKKMVVGPVTSRVFYQIAGRHPDLNRNGIDDYIDIATGTSKDPDRTGVPAEVRQCKASLGPLDAAELAERNARLMATEAERRLRVCGKDCRDARTLEKAVEAAHRVLERQLAAAERALKGFRQCEAKNGLVEPAVR